MLQALAVALLDVRPRLQRTPSRKTASFFASSSPPCAHGSGRCTASACTLVKGSHASSAKSPRRFHRQRLHHDSSKHAREVLARLARAA